VAVVGGRHCTLAGACGGCVMSYNGCFARRAPRGRNDIDPVMSEQQTSFNVGIVGGTGYAGAELLRLLGNHPAANVQVVTSRAQAGTAVAAAYPQLRGIVDLDFRPAETDEFADCDVVF